MNEHYADAEPTKKLFIDTLVRDVDLISAIVDLVDNSVDGARRIRPNGDFRGLAIEMTIDGSQFLLRDNCGGIPLDIAKNYAFRFGRLTNQAPTVAHSVGHFGVGMKRTLFKIAKKFTITSQTDIDEFGLGVDVLAWEDDKEWSFPLSNVFVHSAPLSRVTGTVILVDSLREDVAQEFALGKFRGELRERIRLAHTAAISAGLIISFNGEILSTVDSLTIKSSTEISPHVRRGTYKLSGGTVDYTCISGISDRDSENAGWYVFCNGRLLLFADQTAQTGWGVHPAPSFHQQFNYFRGYLYLESDNPGLLPWNTTKTGMSEDHDVFRRVRNVMAESISEVTQFLNRVRDEEANLKTDANAPTPLKDAITKAKALNVTSEHQQLKVTSKFAWPAAAPRPKTKSDTIKIQYSVDRSKLEALQEFLKGEIPSTSGSAIGLFTLEEYYSLHLGDGQDE
ncbi:ATP-binding protein [Stenotrophomonas sp. 2MCAF14_2]|uniref:ATP-binding protein n=1 Tax=Stenotrophomonas sp. 2MCAF14_2 TaxID=3232983 RepID=UPI003F952435